MLPTFLTQPPTAAPILSARGLRRAYPGAAVAVDGVDLDLAAGEFHALVGESGSGKSTLLRLLAGLEPADTGSVRWGGAAAGHLAMVFQDPAGSFNPRLSVGASLAEPLIIHRFPDRAAKVAAMARRLGLDPASLTRRPAAFSGGQLQRLAIGRALIRDPDLLLLDEPLSALDVSIQAQSLHLLATLRAERGLAFLLVTHDLAVVGAVAERVSVMLAGRIVETGPRDRLFTTPRHPYSAALRAAAPRFGRRREGTHPPLSPPPLAGWGTGCAFAPRCPLVGDPCRRAPPPRQDDGTLCHFPLEGPA